jgi:hypothetical protein
MIINQSQHGFTAVKLFLELKNIPGFFLAYRQYWNGIVLDNYYGTD